MKPVSPRQRLAQALDTIGDIERYAVLSGVSPREFANAQAGRQVATIPFLRICVAVQHDPLPELAHRMPERPSDFDFLLLAIALRMHRGLSGLSKAELAHKLDVSPVTIRRIEDSKASLIGVVLRVCTLVGIHPFGFLGVTNTASISKKIEVKQRSLKVFASPVSRETSTGERA